MNALVAVSVAFLGVTLVSFLKLLSERSSLGTLVSWGVLLCGVSFGLMVASDAKCLEILGVQKCSQWHDSLKVFQVSCAIVAIVVVIATLKFAKIAQQ